MKKTKLGPIFGEAVTGSKRAKSSVSGKSLSRSINWEREEEAAEPVSVWRILPLYLVCIGAFLLLAARAFSLQVIQGSTFQNRSEGNHVRIVISHASRGAILDRNGKVLADSKPGFRLVFDPQNISLETPKLAKELSGLIGIDEKELVSKIEAAQKQKEPSVLKNNLDRSLSLRFLSGDKKFPGVEVEVDPLRSYTDSEAFSNILGYTSEVSKEDMAEKEKNYQLGDKVGRVGIENAFEDQLRGVNGYELVKVDAKGNRLGSFLKTDPLAGSDVTLSIDADLQKQVYASLVEAVKKVNAPGGAAVVMNPKTGEVLAMASYPSYDNNLFAKGLSQEQFNQFFNSKEKPLLNRAIASALPPGSTFKLITAAAALETGTITPETKVEDTGFLNFGGITYNNWLWLEQHRTDGQINVARALARSNDIFFYHIGESLGIDKIDQYAHLFGFGEKTGIEIPGEAIGLVPSPEWKLATQGVVWYPGQTLNTAIGQGDVLVTPIQLAMATSAIANGGDLVRPSLLPTKEADFMRKGFLKKETLATVREGMIENQKGDGNSGFIFGNFPVATAGKTGSAESGGDNNAHAWYTVFAPVTPPNPPAGGGGPQIVATMVVENGGHGSEVSAPAAKKILEWWFGNRK